MSGGPAWRLLSALPAFVVPDVAAAAEHYRDRLGFRICFVVGPPGEQFSIVDLVPGQGVHLMSGTGVPGRRNAIDGQGIDAYLRVGDADEVFASLRARGANLLSEPHDQPWQQREFGVADGDGYVVCVGGDLTGQWPRELVVLSPEFRVADVGRAAAWYQHVLGFPEVRTWGEPPVYAIARRDEVLVHLSALPEGAVPRGNRDAGGAWDAYIECRGVDALCAEIRKRGATILREPETRPYQMRDFDLLDLDGYVLSFGEEAVAPAG
ncbi:MAG TPA: VOC family protein [Planctomycetota bacterium]|nr:VOC family protein [Planctomycetota bacterium]